MTISQVTVTGGFKGTGGGAATGQVRFQLSAPITDMAGTVVSTDPIVCPLVAGAFSTLLYATDDSTTQPAGATYLVTFEVNGLTWQRSFALPHAVTPVDISALVPATPGPVSFTYALASALTAEAATRATADSTNATAIATETTNRGTAVTAEVATRATADSTNATAIATETTRAIAAEGTNATAIATNATAIATETAARTADYGAAGGVATLDASAHLTPSQGLVTLVAASGDVTGATDTAALNAAFALSGRVVLGAGTFWANATLVAHSGLVAIGQGRGNTVIEQVTGVGAFRMIRNFGFSTGGDTNITLRDLTIDGNSSGQTVTSLGLNFQNVAGVTLDIEVRNCWAQGVYLGGCSKVSVDLDTHDNGLDGVNFAIVSSTVNVLTITNVTAVSTTITATVAATATLSVGEPLFISGITGFTTNNPNGQVVVASIPNSTTFTFLSLGAGTPTGTYTSGGTAAPAVLCSDIRGYVRTSNCGWRAVTSIAAASGGQTLPQATITAAATIPQGTTTGFFNPAGGVVSVLSVAPISGILQSNLVAYTGITGATFTGCTVGSGTMVTGGFIGQPVAPGCTFDGATDFDVVVHSYNPGYHGVAMAGGGVCRGRVTGTSVTAGRYGAYVGLGPTDIEVDMYTTGSYFGGFGGEYSPPSADVQFKGTSDGDWYGMYIDTCTGYSFDGIVKNAQKHGIALGGSDHCTINVRHAYNNGLGTDSTYNDVFLTTNTAMGSLHPAASSSFNDITVGVSQATAANKVFSVVDIADITDIRNRVSVGAIDGAHNALSIAGQAASNTRNFALASGGVDPAGFFNLGAAMSGAVGLDTRNGATMGGILTGNVTLTILSGQQIGDTLTLILTQNGTGGFTVTFSGANWRIGSYAVTATASKRDVLRLIWDGTTWTLASAQQGL